MSIPHGLAGKAYAATTLIAATILASGLIAWVIGAPFWAVTGIFGSMVLAIIICIGWLSRQRTGGG